MPRLTNYVDLSFRFLGDDEYDLLTGKHASLRSPCPTCWGTGRYNWGPGPQECECERQRALHLHYLAAGIGELYQRLDWADYEGDPEALDRAETWLSEKDRLCEAGLGLVYLGPFGTGKTMLVSLMAKELVKLGHRVFFTTFAEMIDMFTKTWGGNERETERFERKVVESEVLVLDDIGKEFRRKNNLQESTFDHVLRQRAVALRPTILTTNMTQAEIQSGYGAAVLSMLTERAVVCEVAGSDWRSMARDRTLAEVRAGLRRPIL